MAPDTTPPTAATTPTTEGPVLLRANGVTMQFGGLVAVNAVDLAITPGTIVSVIGPNGAGKTTFFNCIAGIYRPTGGDIQMEGRTIVGLKPNEVTTRGIARTFQNIRLFSNMTALENVLVGRHSRLKAGALGAILRLGWVNREEQAAREKSEELLRLVGLYERRDEFAKNLPYGDQRRLEIARALATEPRLLLLDEPSAGMNPGETADLTRFIRGLRETLDLTILLIEHHMEVVMGISDRVTVLDYGVKIAEGTPDEVRQNPKVIEAYLGRRAA